MPHKLLKKNIIKKLMIAVLLLGGGLVFGTTSLLNNARAEGEPVEQLWEVDQSTNIYVYGIDETLDGGYLITGTQSSNDAHIEKVDKDGNFEWAASSVNPNPGSYYNPEFHSAVEVSEGVFVAVGSVYTSNHYGLLSRFEEVDGVMTETLRWMYHIDHSETVTNNSTYFTDVILDTDGDLIIGANTYISPGYSVFHALKVKNNPVCSAARELGSPACEEDIVWDVAIETDSPENTYGTTSSKMKKGSNDGEFLFMTPFFPKSGALEASPTMVKIVESPDLTSAEMERIGTTMNYKSKNYTDFATLDEKTYIFTGRHCVEKRVVENGIQIEYGDFSGLPCDDSTYYSTWSSLVYGLQVTPDKEYLAYGQSGYNPANGAKEFVGKYDENGNELWSYKGDTITDESSSVGYIAASDISDDGTFAVVSRGKKISKFKDNTLYYHVNYNLVGGVKPDGLVLKRDSALAGTTFNFTDYSTFGDYTLDGWYTDPELTTKFEDYDSPALQDLELYGKYYSAPQSILISNDKMYYTYNDGDPIEVTEEIEGLTWDVNTKTLFVNDYSENDYLPVRIDNGVEPVTVMYGAQDDGYNYINLQSTSPLILDGDSRVSGNITSDASIVIEGGKYKDDIIATERLVVNGGKVYRAQVNQTSLGSDELSLEINVGTVEYAQVGIEGAHNAENGTLTLNNGEIIGAIDMYATENHIIVNSGKINTVVMEHGHIDVSATSLILNDGDVNIGALEAKYLEVNGGKLRVIGYEDFKNPAVDIAGYAVFNGGEVLISGGMMPMGVEDDGSIAETIDMINNMSDAEIAAMCQGSLEEINTEFAAVGLDGFTSVEDCGANLRDVFPKYVRKMYGAPENGIVEFNGGDVTFETADADKLLEYVIESIMDGFSHVIEEEIENARREVESIPQEDIDTICENSLDDINSMFAQYGVETMPDAESCKQQYREKYIELTQKAMDFEIENMKQDLRTEGETDIRENMEEGAVLDLPLIINGGERSVDASAIYIAEGMKKDPEAMVATAVKMKRELNGEIVESPVTVATFGDGNGEVSIMLIFDGDELAGATVENAPLVARIYKGSTTHTITWKDADGNIIQTEEIESGETPVYTGDEPTKETTPKYQYEFIGWSPDDGTTVYPKDESLPPATDTISYTPVFDKEEYTPTSEWIENQEYTIGEDQQAVFRVDIAEKFFANKIEIDGEVATPGEAYDITEGSTIVTLIPWYLDTLAEGEHSMNVYFKADNEDEVVIATTFTAKKNAVPPVPATDDTGDITTGETGFKPAEKSAAVASFAFVVIASVALVLGGKSFIRRK